MVDDEARWDLPPLHVMTSCRGSRSGLLIMTFQLSTKRNLTFTDNIV